MRVSTAIFAGGCFWCLQKVFDQTDGVIRTTVGYTGGRLKNPTYEKVSAGIGGHYEAVKVEYNTEKISYEELVKVFFKNIDPTNPYGQFCDIGKQYETAIFYSNDTEKKIAEKLKEKLEKANITVNTKILPVSEFYEAEEYHQKYYLKYPKEYNYYYEHSQRASATEMFKRIEKILAKEP
ncbi:peptide-methionine (S)-S-oxide reductase MsrA [Hippea alviniae]|uniref:peptide-methionine (S)-S-oxide reductase MsrA n=1 Tax=Hippea alviniae TaxID=1279027 RepID=UPI0003B4A26A|nr:peptide-methionine (S)-S-oxide reductase MsrA [Hippea alviniae]